MRWCWLSTQGRRSGLLPPLWGCRSRLGRRCTLHGTGRRQRRGSQRGGGERGGDEARVAAIHEDTVSIAPQNVHRWRDPWDATCGVGGLAVGSLRTGETLEPKSISSGVRVEIVPCIAPAGLREVTGRDGDPWVKSHVSVINAARPTICRPIEGTSCQRISGVQATIFQGATDRAVNIG